MKSMEPSQTTRASPQDRQYCPPRPGWRALSPQEESATRLYDRCMAAQEGVCWAAARQAYRDATGGG